MHILQSESSPESKDLIRDFLKTHHSGVLSTSSAAGYPHAAPVYFSVEEDFCLLFATKTETLKYKNIQENNRVAFACYDEATQSTVQIGGRAEKVDDPKVHQSTINAIYRYSAELSKTDLPPIEKLFAGDYVIVRIVPEVIKMAVFLRPDSGGYDMYETLTFGSN